MATQECTQGSVRPVVEVGAAGRPLKGTHLGHGPAGRLGSGVQQRVSQVAGAARLLRAPATAPAL